MAKSCNPKRKKAPKTVLKLPDLEQSKSAVLNSLVSSSSQRSYDHAIREFIEWYCSEPRLAFNKTVVTRYRIALEQKHYAPSTINLRLAAVRRLAYEASDSGLLSPDLVAGRRSTCIDVKDQFPMFSDGTPPLFRQAPHIVDQSKQVIPVNSYPLFFHTVSETFRAEAFVCFHIVQNLPAVFKPDDLVVSVFVLVAGRAHPGGKIVQ